MEEASRVDGTRCRAICLAAATSIAHGPAVAQKPPQEQRDTIEEIVVTGSRIPRRDYIAPSPVTTVDQVDFRLAGTTTIEDMLNTLPQVAPDAGRSSNNPGDGTATVNLRGLGTERSLVLLNGRRFLPSDVGGAVDLNNFPPALIERIEVVSGGASAVYGSDALTGAVNFILRDDFEGVEVSAQFDVTERGDGDTLDVNLAGGTSFGTGKGHISGFVNLHDRESIFASDRAFTQQAMNFDIFTGELFPSGSPSTPAGVILNPVDLGGVFAGDGLTFEPDGTPRPFIVPDDFFNFAPFNYIQVPLDRTAVNVFLDYDLTTNLRIYSEYMFVDSSQAIELAPTAVFFERIRMNIDNPFVTPGTRQVFIDNFDPDGDGIAEFFFNKRVPELGSRRVERNTELNRIVAGITADLNYGWTADLHVIAADSDGVVTRSNDGSRSRMFQALLVDPVTMQCFDPSGGCAPADVFGDNSMSPEATDFIRTSPFTFDRNVEQLIVGGSVVGDLAELPAGDLGFALGIEYREDEYAEIPDPAVDNDDQMGMFLDDPVSGKTRLTEVFGEVRVPIASNRTLAKYLALEAGYRYSDHNLAGGFDTSKLSLEWELYSGVMLRGSVQEAVRAPSAIEYFEAETMDINPFISGNQDLCSASRMPVALGVDQLCIAQGIPASEIGIYEATPFFPTLETSSGNPDLDPERSDTVTAGLVLQPDALPGLQFSIDYYSIEIDNAIQSLGAGDVVTICFLANDPAEPLCQDFERDPVTFNISTVDSGPRNIAVLRTKGVDVQLNLHHDLPDWLSLLDDASSLRWWILGTYVLENGFRETPAVSFRECEGRVGPPCNLTSFGTLPEIKIKARVTYETGPLALSFQWRHIDRMEFAFIDLLEELGIPRDSLVLFRDGTPKKDYYALSFDYAFGDRFELYGGIQNLTDTNPPQLAAAGQQSNTDPSAFDVYGRRYYLGVTARFGN